MESYLIPDIVKLQPDIEEFLLTLFNLLAFNKLSACRSDDTKTMGQIIRGSQNKFLQNCVQYDHS